MTTIRRSISEIAKKSVKVGIKKGYLAEDYDGISSTVQILMSRGSASAVQAAISAGSFGTEQTFAAGTPVFVLEYGGHLEVVSLGSKLSAGAITLEMLPTTGLDASITENPVITPGTLVSAAFAPDAYIRNLINGPATVTIDSGGLTVENGALILKDEFGSTVMVSSGFTGPWNDYVALGVYNPVFGAGVDTTLPEGRTSYLPYWTVDKVVGSPTITRRADTAFPSGHSVRVVFAAVNDKVTIESDAFPVQGGIDYSIQAIAGWNKTVAGSTWVTSVYLRWYDGNLTYISGGAYGPLGPAVGVTGTQVPKVWSWTSGGQPAPLTARYAKIQFSIEQTSAHDTGAHYWDIGMIRVGAAPTCLDQDPGGYETTDMQIYNYFAVGATTSATLFEVDNDGSFYLNNYDTSSMKFKVSATGLITSGGTSFPASPGTNDHFYRTDLGMWFFYDGTRWLSTTLYVDTWDEEDQSATFNHKHGFPGNPWQGDIYAVDLTATFFVASGTALGASHKWVGVFTALKSDNTAGATTFATVTVASGASLTWRVDTQAVGQVMAYSTTNSPAIKTTWTKTGTPGNFYVYEMLRYRIVAT